MRRWVALAGLAWVVAATVPSAQITTGSITGTITRDAAGGGPVQNVLVQVQTTQGAFVGQGSTDANGVYTVSGLAPGTYVVRTFFAPAAGLVDEYHPNLTCPGASCNAGSATPVTVQSAQATTVDFGLATGGSISGVVTSEGQESSYLESVFVSVFLRLPNGSLVYAGDGVSDFYGAYVVGGLPAGDYVVKTNSYSRTPAYVDELYDNISCPADTCNYAAGTSVAVGAGSAVQGIDFALAEGMSIEGVVQESCGEPPCAPITSASVEVYTPSGQYITAVWPDEAGSYFTPGLPIGSYKARVVTYAGNYIDEAWDDQPCVGALCDMSTAGNLVTPVFGEPSIADFYLRAGGQVTGTVTSAIGAVGPLANASVQIYKLVNGTPQFVKSVGTASDGTYLVTGLQGGSGAVGYKAFASGSAAAHASEVYAGRDCVNVDCDIAAGTTFEVMDGGGTTGNIDFSLNRLGIVEGVVSNAKTANALTGATVTLFRTGNATALGSVASDQSGLYRFGALQPGNYTVRVTAAGFRGEVFDNVFCVGAPSYTTCDPSLGTPVAAVINTVTSANVALNPLHTLQVELAGTGAGRVAVLGTAIDCRNDGDFASTCDEVVPDGQLVTFVAVPAGGSVFAGWSGGGCSGTGFCDAVVTGATTVTATFAEGGGPPTLVSALPSSGSAAGGTPVTITGTNLAFATAVIIGDVPATVLSATATTIGILTPPGTAGPRDVLVITPAGNASLPGGFTYTGAAKVTDEAVGANAPTLQPSLNQDGRYLAFLSLASNLVDGDTNGAGDIFVRDRATGGVVRVSVSSSGAQANGPSERPRISGDGRYVAFVSSASNLVAGDLNGVADVFVHDRDPDGNGVFDEPGSRDTFRVSVASDGREADAASGQPDLSADGLWVAFVSDATNLVGDDTNGVADVFRHHWPSGQTRRVSVATGGGQANGPSRAPSVSEGGRRVAFASDASNLVGNDGNGVRDVFIHDRDDASTVRVSTAAGTENDANGASDNPSIDDAGGVIAFQTTATNITTGPAGAPGVSQVVVVVLPPPPVLPDILVPSADARQGAAFVAGPVVSQGVVNIADAIRQIASQNNQGQAGGGDSTDPEVSGDGNAVGFVSESDDLVLGDSNGSSDVFVSQITPQGDPEPPVRVSVDTQGDEASGDSQEPALSGDGRLVSFESEAQLTPESTPGNPSVFVRGEQLLVAGVSVQSALVNTSVTVVIEGTGFQEGVSVRFGSRFSPGVQRESATRLTAAVPIGTLPGVIDIVLTNPDGESFTVRNGFTYVTPPGSSSDADADGLPDAWEVQVGLDPSSATGINGGTGDADGDGQTNAQELRAGTHPRGTFVRYLAEGASTSFFTTRIAVANPSPTTPANVLLRFLRSDGVTVPAWLVVPPSEIRKVVVNDAAGMVPAEFSTVIESDYPVVVDRLMTWGGVEPYGSHAEGALKAPATTWYLAEGATHSGFDLFYLLQNPSSATPAEVKVRYLRPSGAPLEKTYVVAPGSRSNIWVNLEEFPAAGSGDFALANTDVSAVVEVTNDVPIVVERAMYLSRPGRMFDAGHGSAAVPAPALSWFLAEGATGPFFDEFILLANPSATAAQATITYLLEGGTTYTRSVEVPAASRRTVWVDIEQPDGTTGFPLSDAALSARVDVTNGVPIIVERAMWWGGSPASWYEAHNSQGATATGTLWAVAEGESRATTRTFLLVANPSAQVADVSVTLVFEGQAPVTRTFQVGATSRRTIDVGAEFPEAAGREFGALVESVGATAAPIVVEQAIYSDAQGVFWAAGSNQLATRIR